MGDCAIIFLLMESKPTPEATLSEGQVLSEEQDIRQLLAENNNLLKAMAVDVVRLNRYMKWNRIWSLLKLLIVVVPLVLGIIYLKPYAQSVFSAYGELFGSPRSGNANFQSLDLLEQLKQYQQKVAN